MVAGAQLRSDEAGAPAPVAAAQLERAPAAALERVPASGGPHERAQLLDGTTVRLAAIDLDLSPCNALDERVVLIADDGRGRVIGRASFSRVYGPRAVLELEVDAALSHLGLPAMLVERLCARAGRAGVTTFVARVPAARVELLALLRGTFGARDVRDGAFVDVEFATSPTGSPATT